MLLEKSSERQISAHTRIMSVPSSILPMCDSQLRIIPFAFIHYAVKRKLREDGDTSTASLLAKYKTSSPTFRSNILRRWKNLEVIPAELSPEKPLSLFIRSNLSKADYKILLSIASIHGQNLYPSYFKVLKTKKKHEEKKIDRDRLNLITLPTSEDSSTKCDTEEVTTVEESSTDAET